MVVLTSDQDCQQVHIRSPSILIVCCLSVIMLLIVIMFLVPLAVPVSVSVIGFDSLKQKLLDVACALPSSAGMLLTLCLKSTFESVL